MFEKYIIDEIELKELMSELKEVEYKGEEYGIIMYEIYSLFIPLVESRIKKESIFIERAKNENSACIKEDLRSELQLDFFSLIDKIISDKKEITNFTKFFNSSIVLNLKKIRAKYVYQDGYKIGKNDYDLVTALKGARSRIVDYENLNNEERVIRLKEMVYKENQKGNMEIALELLDNKRVEMDNELLFLGKEDEYFSNENDSLSKFDLLIEEILSNIGKVKDNEEEMYYNIISNVKGDNDECNYFKDVSKSRSSIYKLVKKMKISFLELHVEDFDIIYDNFLIENDVSEEDLDLIKKVYITENRSSKELQKKGYNKVFLEDINKKINSFLSITFINYNEEKIA